MPINSQRIIPIDSRDEHKTSEKDATSPSNADELVQAIRSAIRISLAGRSLTIDRCARQVGISRRALQRNLTAAGFTFTRLVDQVRREMAEELLADETRTIGEIADQLNYSNAANFARAFHRLSGTTPTQFRQNAEHVMRELNERRSRDDHDHLS